jgi:hypothetical protein
MWQIVNRETRHIRKIRNLINTEPDYVASSIFIATGTRRSLYKTVSGILTFILQSVHLLYNYAMRINFCFIRTMSSFSIYNLSHNLESERYYFFLLKLYYIIQFFHLYHTFKHIKLGHFQFKISGVWQGRWRDCDDDKRYISVVIWDTHIFRNV